MPERPYRIRPFDPLFGPTVAGWVRDDAELFWLAPSTTSPLTAAKVLGWAKPQGRALLLFPEDESLPCGYAELNPLRGSTSQWWVGHVVVAPSLRGRGVGKLFTRLLMEEAFVDRRVDRLVMVVFPDNEAALHCYRAAGFRVTSRERHRFRPNGPDHVMMRLEITRAEAALAMPGAVAQ
ncbi:MAG: GNAT family N-acetyltransferase [Planctomycetota bacterium]|jgi:ribosomal protein S18 acetylase RimI-like enzyme